MESTKPRGGRRKGRTGRARGQKTGGMLASLHGRHIILENEHDQRSPSSPQHPAETGPEVAETLGLNITSSCNSPPRENNSPPRENNAEKENNCQCFAAVASPNNEVNADTPSAPLTSVKMGLDKASRSLFSPLSPNTPARKSSDGIEPDSYSDDEKSQSSDATDNGANSTDASDPFDDDSPRDQCFEEASDASNPSYEGEESDCDEDYTVNSESEDDSLHFDDESEERGRRRKKKAQKTKLPNASKVFKALENDATSLNDATSNDGANAPHNLSTQDSSDSETISDEPQRRHLKGCRAKLSDKLGDLSDETDPNQNDPPKIGQDFDWGIYSHLKGGNADRNVPHDARPVLKSSTERQSRRKVASSKSADFMANVEAAIAKSNSTETFQEIVPAENDDDGGDVGSPELSHSVKSAASTVSETIEDEQGSVTIVMPPTETVTADAAVLSPVPSESDLFKVVDDLFNHADTDTVTVRDVVKSVGIHFGLQKIDKATKARIKGRLTDLIHGDVTPEVEGKSSETSEHAHDEPDEIESGTAQESLDDFGGGTDFSIDASEVEIDDENDSGAGILSLSPNCGAIQLDRSGSSLDAQIVSPREQEEFSANEARSAAITTTAPGTTQEQICQQQLEVEASSNAETIYTPEPTKEDPSKQQHSDAAGLESVDEESVVSGSSSLFQNLSPDMSVKSSNSRLGSSIQSTLSTSLNDTRSCIVVKGKWSLGSEIGKGSFGRVYMGMNGVSGNFMAVKILQIPNDNRRAIIDDLQREIDLMKTLKHPNIVRYLGAEVDRPRNILHIFQEWAPGGSVSSLLRQFGGPFTTAVVRSYTSQILSGLQYLHSHGIIHRDIKGGNILVSSDGSIKVADFGASKRVEVLSDEPDEMEMTMRGTPYFMALEVFEERYGAKADIWSVGGVIYQMVTGSPPWKNLGFKSPISLFMHLKSHDRPPELPYLSQCSDNERQQLLSILKRCFQRDPSLRPSASDLQHDPFLTCTASSSPAPSSPDPMGAVFIKSPALKRPVSPLIKIPEEHATLESTLSDSLCYSMTIGGPLVLTKGDNRTSKYNMSDWPKWAIDKEREERSTFIGQQPNPYG